MTRDELKVIVKECLIELLSDIIINGNSKKIQPQRTNNQIKGVVESTQRKRQFDPRLDTPVTQTKQHLTSLVKNVANGDPIMESIFADTAKTTLQDQLEHDSNVGQANKQQLIEHVGSLDTIFDEKTISSWSSLAFSQPKRSE